MASSTTNPVATVSAISERLSRLYLNRNITAKVPSKLTVTATPGISVARPFLRKTSTTSTTRTMASNNVRSTSRSEARMVMVRSIDTLSWMAGGSCARIRGSAA